MFVDCVAVHKVRYLVRHFGGVFIFPVARGKISIFAGHGGRLGARSARFFKDLGFRAPKISKVSLSPQGPEGLSEPT